MHFHKKGAIASFPPAGGSPSGAARTPTVTRERKASQPEAQAGAALDLSAALRAPQNLREKTGTWKKKRTGIVFDSASDRTISVQVQHTEIE